MNEKEHHMYFICLYCGSTMQVTNLYIQYFVESYLIYEK